MKSYLAVAVAAGAFALASGAQAQTQVEGYASPVVTALFGDGYDISVLGVRAGANIGEYFAVEAEGAFGIGGTSGVDLNYVFAAFARGRVPVGENAEVFGRVGVYTTELEYYRFSLTETDVAVGGGVQFDFHQGVGLRVEYTNFGFQDSHAISAGAVFKF